MDNINYTIEFLNSLKPPGIPPHHLNFKTGTCIILLRNIEVPRLCNGTRLVVEQMYDNVIEATMITGKVKHIDVIIPKIPFVPSSYSFEFRILQFPIKLFFAITINKA